jgi:hypothetical protein
VNFYCIFIKSIQLVLGKLGRKQILLFTPLWECQCLYFIFKKWWV